MPPDVPGGAESITCDGRVVLFNENTCDHPAYPIPVTKDAEALWRWANRPRSGCIRGYDLAGGSLTKLVELEGLGFQHVEASPTDPTLVRFCRDMLEMTGQRIWTVRTDGSDLRPIRHQESGEMITHEFWWAGGDAIGYTYQDRRGDTTVQALPWCEYAPTSTELGIANLDGTERFLSDPLNHYHSHILVSPDGQWVCGEGTDGHNFVYAAPFSWENTRVRFLPMATIHTPYVPTRGQSVDAGFSTDSRWLIYNDTVDGVMQVCAVRVEE